MINAEVDEEIKREPVKLDFSVITQLFVGQEIERCMNHLVTA